MKCNNCGLNKPKQDFYFRKDSQKYRPICKVCWNIKANKWAEKNPERRKQMRQRWIKKNPEKNREAKRKYKRNNKDILRIRERESTNKWQKNRRETDPLFKVIQNLRTRTNNYLRSIGKNRNMSISKIIGCSKEQLQKHLELLFQEGMTWDNYGKWQIDHKVPLSSAGDIEEVQKLGHYSNLQPLWAEDNLFKSNKIIKEEKQ